MDQSFEANYIPYRAGILLKRDLVCTISSNIERLTCDNGMDIFCLCLDGLDILTIHN